MILKLCQLIEFQISRVLMEKTCRKCAPKVISGTFLILVYNSKKSLHSRILLKIGHFERGLSKSLETFKFLFLFERIMV